MNCLKHLKLYHKYVEINFAKIVRMGSIALACIVLYQFAICKNIMPRLYAAFSSNVISIIIFVMAGIIFSFSWLLILYKSNEMLRSKKKRFLQSIGFIKKDIALLLIYENILSAFISGALITATFINHLNPYVLIRYAYQPFLLAVALLTLAIPISFLSTPKRVTKIGRERCTANKIFFKNKYLANLYKDLLLLKGNVEFILLLLIESLLLVLFFAFIPYNRQVYYIFLYMLIWFASLITQTAFIIDEPYSMMVKSLFPDKKEFFTIKLFEITMFCILPALIFLLINVGIGNMQITDFLLSAIIIASMSLVLASGSVVIALSYFPNIKKSTLLMIIYYSVGTVYPLIIIFSSAITIKYWRSENARSKRFNKNI